MSVVTAEYDECSCYEVDAWEKSNLMHLFF